MTKPFRFTPSDFECCDDCMCSMKHADQANEKLEEWLKEMKTASDATEYQCWLDGYKCGQVDLLAYAPVVYGLGEYDFEIMRRTPAVNATHKAKLICIEELKEKE